MRKFKIGDKVIRIEESSILVKGQIYTIKHIKNDANNLKSIQLIENTHTKEYFFAENFKLANSDKIKKKLGIK